MEQPFVGFEVVPNLKSLSNTHKACDQIPTFDKNRLSFIRNQIN
jgi:hypothetical protein